MPVPAAAAPPLIEFDRVRVEFGPARPALLDLSFSVGRGELVAINGANGAGKSTLLQLVIGEQRPASGQVRVAGEEPARLRGRALAALRRAIGVVPQDLQLLADRSVLENVMLPALAAGLSRRQARVRARAALERVGLADSLDRPAAAPGSAQLWTALARAIVNRPALLLADEPAALLDAAGTQALMRMLVEFVGSGVTVVLASHDDSSELPSSARRLRLVDGRLAP